MSGSAPFEALRFAASSVFVEPSGSVRVQESYEMARTDEVLLL
jgi:hypothetical protein